MSRWLALAKTAEIEHDIPVRHLTKCDKTPSDQLPVGFCRVLSNCHTGQETKSHPRAPDDFKHGFALNGYPKTWTGKVVSLEDWRRLSPWERHGPDGRLWNGKTQRWEITDD